MTTRERTTAAEVRDEKPAGLWQTVRQHGRRALVGSVAHNAGGGVLVLHIVTIIGLVFYIPCALLGLVSTDAHYVFGGTAASSVIMLLIGYFFNPPDEEV